MPRSPIKRMRQDRDWYQIDLARESGVSHSTISRFERGLLKPSAENLLAIAKALGCKVEDLFETEAVAS